MFNLQTTLLAGVALLFSSAVFASTPTADHSKFEELQGDFATGPDVTAACLGCHTEAASQMQKTMHWQWKDGMPSGEVVGKMNVVNNFCVAVNSNEPRCTSCHVGYGYKDQKFDFSANNETAVDCLVCHDTTKEYKKFPVGAGHPNYKPAEWPKGSGKIRPVANLSKVAQNVGLPDRDNCGSCHFFGGGGDGVKSGDRDSSLSKPSLALDVHMSPDGQDFACQACHTADGHAIAGSRNQPMVHDTVGIDFPGHTDGNRASCESCHDQQPHKSDGDNKSDIKKVARLNGHTRRVACQTCHIPQIAREKPTKTWWDWSTAGKKNDAGKPYVVKGDLGKAVYNSKKGDFVWETNVTPTYIWFNGEMDHSTIGEAVAPGEDGVIELIKLGGSVNDPNAKLTPFKVMRGKQPWDPVNKKMIVPHLFGKDKAAYWKSYDWQKASAAGQKASGVDFSGTVEFIETSYPIPVNHMVGPADTSLKCESCHNEDVDEPWDQLSKQVFDAEDLLEEEN